MNYISYLNGIIRERTGNAERIVLFGQNIDAGSCLSGLTRGLRVKQGSMVINTPNSENSLCGIGFGLMMGGVDSIFFMKQLDFLLLGIDHLVNTYNFIRRTKPSASFTIFPCIVDNGYQGLQSSFNGLADICSLARIRGFVVTNKIDADRILGAEMIAPGFRIIGVSSRLFQEELIEPALVFASPDNTFFQYAEGDAATVVCFNFSFPYGHELQKKMGEKGLRASLFSVNVMTPTDWARIVDDVKRTKKLVIFDDSKGENRPSSPFLGDVLLASRPELCERIVKDMSGDWLSPNKDSLHVDYDQLVRKIAGGSSDAPFSQS